MTWGSEAETGCSVAQSSSGFAQNATGNHWKPLSKGVRSLDLF